MGVQEYKNQIDIDITTKTEARSIPPTVVGKAFKDLADLLTAATGVSYGSIPAASEPLLITWSATEPVSNIPYASKHGALASVVIQLYVVDPLDAARYAPVLSYYVNLTAGTILLDNTFQDAFYIIK